MVVPVRRILPGLLPLALVTTLQAQGRSPVLVPQQSGTTQRLQAISVVSDSVAWASGAGGTYTVTVDGGRTWRAGVVPGADSLEFRDVEARSAEVAWLLAAGPGDRSRVYHTRDGGRTWRLQFTNSNPDAFYDCFAFWDGTRGVAMSDAVQGQFPVIRTDDGEHWQVMTRGLPPALAGEGAFAASGTCVAVLGDRLGWIATGAGPRSRILRTTDGGGTWTAHPVPTVQGSPASGTFSVAFRDPDHGILGAGDLAQADSVNQNIAVSRDGGVTWELATHTPFPGAVYGLAYVPGVARNVVATGPGGAAWSVDEGRSWQLLPEAKDYWAAGFGSRTGWLVGTGGRILRVSF